MDAHGDEGVAVLIFERLDHCMGVGAVDAALAGELLQEDGTLSDYRFYLDISVLHIHFVATCKQSD
jgi:hypothetical protein